LVASGLATPAAVKRASYIAFGVAAVVGAVLSIVVAWWLIPIGLVCIVAAATYTGGPKPYGYVGLGEVMVLVFFGFVATVGSTFVQHESVPGITWIAALAVGLPAVGILLANNLRDIETDRVAGKRTLAVRMGVRGARFLYVGAIAGALLAVVVCGLAEPWALLGLVATPLALGPVRLVRTRLDPPSLVRALIMTARFQLVLSAFLALGFALG
jgi:1,4-dihydroxy-2-naphthoate octaprenyltransferase